MNARVMLAAVFLTLTATSMLANAQGRRPGAAPNTGAGQRPSIGQTQSRGSLLETRRQESVLQQMQAEQRRREAEQRRLEAEANNQSEPRRLEAEANNKSAEARAEHPPNEHAADEAFLAEGNQANSELSDERPELRGENRNDRAED